MDCSYCCSENLLFWKKTERAWFSPKKIKKENNNFFLKCKEKDEFRSSIQLIWMNRKKTKKDLVKKKEPQIRANLKMTSERKDELKHQTSYILKARRQTKSFVLFWANAQEFLKNKTL